jgi:hypothetical protein
MRFHLLRADVRFTANKQRPSTPKAAGVISISVTIDHDRSAVMVPVLIAVFPDDDGPVAIPMIAVTIVFTIPVPISFVHRTNRDAARPHADSDFLRSGRY